MTARQEPAAGPQASVLPPLGGAVYRLTPAVAAQPLGSPPPPPDLVDPDLLRRQAAWFCRLRWLVVAILALAGLVGATAPGGVAGGLRLSPVWPWTVAVLLAGLNLAYLRWIPSAGAADRRLGPRHHLWVQIGLDLLVLTAVIHFLGSVETYAPLMYLVHIILACIFFPPAQSLRVTAVAALLYLGCLALELHGVIQPATVLVHTGMDERAALGIDFYAWRLGATFVIWTAIWYLASGLAAMLRRRESELAVTNQRLRASSEERTRHMLQTTHQLKAPLAAIHANTQLLLGGYCGQLPESALAVMGKVMERSVSLAAQIQRMLQLANLRSESQAPPPVAELDLAVLLQTTVAALEATATRRQIRLVCSLQSAMVWAAEDHLRMLCENLVSNAVNYSHDGGQVRVCCRPAAAGGADVLIADEGIGIPEDKLAKVFEDYFRTTEATKHNKASSGLGLAVVRDVVRLTGITLEVESRVGHGTRFSLAIPRRAHPTAVAPPGAGRSPAWHMC
jgi:signal transduction histidine kinase